MPRRPGEKIIDVKAIIKILSLREGKEQKEALVRSNLDERSATFGCEHSGVLTGKYELASLLVEQGRWAEAEVLSREALDGRRRALGAGHSDTKACLDLLQLTLSQQDKHAESESVIHERLTTFGTHDAESLNVMYGLAVALLHQGKFVDAEPLFVNMLAAHERTLGWAHPATQKCASHLAAVQRKLAKRTPMQLQLAKRMAERSARAAKGDEAALPKDALAATAAARAVVGADAAAGAGGGAIGQGSAAPLETLADLSSTSAAATSKRAKERTRESALQALRAVGLEPPPGCPRWSGRAAAGAARRTGAPRGGA